jgi:hypothetical protein
MMGGPSPNPNDDLTYKLPDTKMQNEEAIKQAGGSMSFFWNCSGVNLFLCYLSMRL